MIKNKGDRKVETFEHARRGTTCDIYLRGTKFVATLLEKEFEAPDVSILREKLRDYAEHWITMEWFTLIELEIEDRTNRYRESTTGESISLERTRFYVSKSPAGMMFQV